MMTMMHIIKCVPDQLGRKIHLIAVLTIVYICLVFMSCSHSVNIFSHFENTGGYLGRHLLFSLRVEGRKKVSNDD